MSENKTLPYSYHTFLFPFLWNDANKVSRTEFVKCFRKGWELDTISETVKPSNKEFYDQYHYFNRAARNALYTTSAHQSEVVRNYRYDLERLNPEGSYSGNWLSNEKREDNPAKYVIQKEDKKKELAINGLRLKLFNTGVGMLIFELENYSCSDEESIIFINEFGRRVFMPYLNTNTDRTCKLCADCISLMYGGKEISGASGKVSGAEQEYENETKLAQPIAFFLSNDNGYSITTSKVRASKKNFFIEPIIDDRMFVACFYENKDFVNGMAVWEDGKYKYLHDAENYIPNEKSVLDPQGKPSGHDNVAAQLYKMMFVDGVGLSCHSRVMLKSLLEKHIYDRWLEYAFCDDKNNLVKSGSITGITEYSMITVASFAPAVVAPFLTEYIEMVILVLAQRASLLAFERTISEIACQKNKMDVDRVQRDYVIFQSELLLQEVTPQQQGIELYDMLIDNLFINKQQKEIENQIKSLFELNTTSHEKTENCILFILAVLGIVDVVNVIFKDWFRLCSLICGLISLVAVVAIVVWKLARRKNWRKAKRD